MHFSFAPALARVLSFGLLSVSAFAGTLTLDLTSAAPLSPTYAGAAGSGTFSGAISGLQIADKFVPFDVVVSTVPLPYVPRLIPDLPSEVMTKLQALRNKVILLLFQSNDFARTSSVASSGYRSR